MGSNFFLIPCCLIMKNLESVFTYPVLISSNSCFNFHLCPIMEINQGNCEKLINVYGTCSAAENSHWKLNNSYVNQSEPMSPNK